MNEEKRKEVRPVSEKERREERRNERTSVREKERRVQLER